MRNREYQELSGGAEAGILNQRHVRESAAGGVLENLCEPGPQFRMDKFLIFQVPHACAMCVNVGRPGNRVQRTGTFW